MPKVRYKGLVEEWLRRSGIELTQEQKDELWDRLAGKDLTAKETFSMAREILREIGALVPEEMLFRREPIEKLEKEQKEFWKEQEEEILDQLMEAKGRESRELVDELIKLKEFRIREGLVGVAISLAGFLGLLAKPEDAAFFLILILLGLGLVARQRKNY